MNFSYADIKQLKKDGKEAYIREYQKFKMLMKLKNEVVKNNTINGR